MLWVASFLRSLARAPLTAETAPYSHLGLSQDSREPTEVLQTVVAGGAEDETMSVVDEALSDAMDSDFGAGVDPEGQIDRASTGKGGPFDAF